MIDKKEIVELCLEKTQKRVNEIQVAIDAANDAIVNDTKSSMGDKYETSREMAQQELSRLQSQLNQANRDLDILINLPDSTIAIVGMGSLVITNQFNYLLATSIGPLKVGSETVMVVSKQSPIGEALFGKKVLDEVQFNGKTFQIQDLG
ncbi:hypothetical protein [Sphingobacterium sp. BN32]|uniref:hypothetical protein n=1 Tax=Sphingobacterium sp. BN32 TaxID=3058432 RepID=UPI00265C9922|nr:hypothetical protein [Sphingobacterium sp. BN32]WKK59753.1 hypothetical protein QYC40_05825 [Sphingobacterium sp. BN32]